MTSLVASHLVNGVVDSVEIQLLCHLCQLELACGCAVLSLYTNGQVLLGGVGNNLAEKLCELRCVLSLFKSSFLPVQSDFGVALRLPTKEPGYTGKSLKRLAYSVGAHPP